MRISTTAKSVKKINEAPNLEPPTEARELYAETVEEYLLAGHFSRGDDI